MDSKITNKSKGISKGTFTNGIQFLSFGKGNKVLVTLIGGPGNVLGDTEYNVLKALENDYKIYVMSRKSNIPEGYTVKDIAQDCAEAIQQDLGTVFGIIGTSYGGLVIQEIAYKYPEIAEKYIIWGAAYTVDRRGAASDSKFASLITQGRAKEALGVMLPNFFYSNFKTSIMKLLVSLFGGIIAKSMINEEEMSDTFNSDILIEAKAESEFNCENILKDIKVPMLVIGGSHDYYFSKESTTKTADLIPEAELKIIEKAGHLEVFTKKEALNAVLEYLTRQ